MEIIPAILPKDFSEIEEKINLIKGLVKVVQIDICDGKFVPSITWPLKKPDINYESILKEERGMPEWESLDYEFDLMIDNPELSIENWIALGGIRIVIHAGAKGDIEKAIDIASDRADIGLGLHIDNPINLIDKYKDKIKYIQLMGIDKVGFQGQPFDAKVLDKIKEVKEKYPDLPIQIDGAVNLEDALDLKNAGANRLVVGSALFKSDNIVDTYKEFKSI
jgi:ribulose-phosphate 3-epimerase